MRAGPAVTAKDRGALLTALIRAITRLIDRIDGQIGLARTLAGLKGSPAGASAVDKQIHRLRENHARENGGETSGQERTLARQEERRRRESKSGRPKAFAGRTPRQASCPEGGAGQRRAATSRPLRPAARLRWAPAPVAGGRRPRNRTRTGLPRRFRAARRQTRRGVHLRFAAYIKAVGRHSAQALGGERTDVHLGFPGQAARWGGTPVTVRVSGGFTADLLGRFAWSGSESISASPQTGNQRTGGHRDPVLRGTSKAFAWPSFRSKSKSPRCLRRHAR
jgi:hypothetical protein